VPQVVVYGPTHPAWSAHALEHTTLIRREELACLNCHHKQCPLDDHPCMTRIQPDDLLAALHEIPELENGDR
jgi:ADP-heptose:LPS heptosyltransferase